MTLPDASSCISLTLVEAAWLLQVTVNQVRRMVASGRLQVMPGGGRTMRVAVSDVAALTKGDRARRLLRELASGNVEAPRPSSPSAAARPLSTVIVTSAPTARKVSATATDAPNRP